MTGNIILSRTGGDEARIIADGEYVGDLIRCPDCLRPGEFYYVIHLDEDPRGFLRVHDRFRVMAEVTAWIETHPYR